MNDTSASRLSSQVTNDTNEAGPSTLPSGFESWRTSLAQFTGLGLTDEQRAERELAKENGTLAKDWDRCEKWKKDLIERSESSHYFYIRSQWEIGLMVQVQW